MSVSRERLESRLAELQRELDQLKQQYLSVSGAIADIQYWLAEDAKPEENKE